MYYKWSFSLPKKKHIISIKHFTMTLHDGAQLLDQVWFIDKAEMMYQALGHM